MHPWSTWSTSFYFWRCGPIGVFIVSHHRVAHISICPHRRRVSAAMSHAHRDALNAILLLSLSLSSKHLSCTLSVGFVHNLLSAARPSHQQGDRPPLSESVERGARTRGWSAGVGRRASSARLPAQLGPVRRPWRRHRPHRLPSTVPAAARQQVQGPGRRPRAGSAARAAGRL